MDYRRGGPAAEVRRNHDRVGPHLLGGSAASLSLCFKRPYRGFVRHGPNRVLPDGCTARFAERTGLRGRRRPRNARQEMLGLRSDNHRPLAGEETDDQADFLLRAADLVPGDPDAVRMAEVRLAVVPGELLGREDVFSIGLRVGGPAAFLIECIHDQRALDQDRFVDLLGVERQPAAKTPRRKAVGLVQDRVGPDRGHTRRHRGKLLGLPEPRNRLVQVQLRATQRQHQIDQRNRSVGKSSGGWHKDSFHRTDTFPVDLSSQVVETPGRRWTGAPGAGGGAVTEGAPGPAGSGPYRSRYAW